MIAALDSSVIVAALRMSEAYHQESLNLVRQARLHILAHAMAETFSTLTGSRIGRMPAGDAARALRTTIVPRVAVVELTAEEFLRAIEEAESRGIRGGAIYDYLHLAAARKAGAERLCTLNVSDFQSFHRPGDPEIVHP